MSDAFVSEIRAVGFNFPPKGWAQANGQLMAISQNTALFSLLGTSFGGNGTSNFALPDLQGRMPMHSGQGSGLSPRIVGEFGGVESATQQGTPIPGSPVSPVSASVGFAPQLLTISPFCVVNFIIALQGIFPARS